MSKSIPTIQETVPLILETLPSSDYALLDSGLGQKLEQYGAYRIIRPEAQALWEPRLPQTEWHKADAIFTGNTDEEGIGRWSFPHKDLNETWPMQWDKLDFLGRFTSFRHVGVFPEQAAHWHFIQKLIRDSNRPIRVLNLFAYTGIASLISARAGAEVTHVDASKKAIGWAKENQLVAKMSNHPIRWICEDASRFVARELRRQKQYDLILLDPPAFGRGPNGEVWQLFEDLPLLLPQCRDLLSPNCLGMILTTYSIRASFFAVHEWVHACFADRGGYLQSGELILRDKTANRPLSTSLFSRWIAHDPS